MEEEADEMHFVIPRGFKVLSIPEDPRPDLKQCHIYFRWEGWGQGNPGQVRWTNPGRVASYKNY